MDLETRSLRKPCGTSLACTQLIQVGVCYCRWCMPLQNFTQGIKAPNDSPLPFSNQACSSVKRSQELDAILSQRPVLVTCRLAKELVHLLSVSACSCM